MRYLLVLILFFITAESHAQQSYTGKVTYLTSTSAYVNLGTNHGFDVGDTLRIMNKGKVAAILHVATVASKSLSAIILSKNTDLREGDEVVGFTARSPKTVQQPIQTTNSPGRTDTDTTHSRSIPSSPSTTQQAQVPSQESHEENIIHGRLGLQYYALYNNSNSQLEFSQPAAVLNFTLDKIFGAPLAFNFYLNSRYDARSQQLRTGVDYPRMTNRVYEASLKYGRDSSLINFLFGRFVAPVIGGVGTFDGAMVTMQKGDLQFGIVAGTQPGWRNSDVQLSNPKFSAFASYQTGDYSSTRYQGSFAYAQQYYSNNLDRGFFYLQNTVTFSNSLSLYQNADFDLHDLVNGENKTSLHLSDFFLSASYRPLNWLSASGSYAIRRNIYFLESFKFIPDSLFDKSFLQNVQLSVGIRLPMTMYLTTTGSLRLKEGDPRNATSLLANWSWADIFNSQVGMYISGNIADNIYNKSNSIGIDIHRDIIQDLYVSLKARRYSYIYSSSSRTINRTTIGADILYRMSRMLYSSVSYERYFEESLTTDRLYAELSIRL